MEKILVLSYLSVVTLLISSCKDPERKNMDFPNYLKNTSWIINNGELIIPDVEKNYSLSQRIDTAIISNFHAIDFLDEEKFKSYDSWECGNDCFTKVHGRYSFIGLNQLRLEVDSITKSGTCQAPTQTFNSLKILIFNISKEKQQLMLIKQ